MNSCEAIKYIEEKIVDEIIAGDLI